MDLFTLDDIPDLDLSRSLIVTIQFPERYQGNVLLENYDPIILEVDPELGPDTSAIPNLNLYQTRPDAKENVQRIAVKIALGVYVYFVDQNRCFLQITISADSDIGASRQLLLDYILWFWASLAGSSFLIGLDYKQTDQDQQSLPKRSSNSTYPIEDLSDAILAFQSPKNHCSDFLRIREDSIWLVILESMYPIKLCAENNLQPGLYYGYYSNLNNTFYVILRSNQVTYLDPGSVHIYDLPDARITELTGLLVQKIETIPVSSDTKLDQEQNWMIITKSLTRQLFWSKINQAYVVLRIFKKQDKYTVNFYTASSRLDLEQYYQIEEGFEPPTGTHIQLPIQNKLHIVTPENIIYTSEQITDTYVFEEYKHFTFERLSNKNIYYDDRISDVVGLEENPSAEYGYPVKAAILWEPILEVVDVYRHLAQEIFILSKNLKQRVLPLALQVAEFFTVRTFGQLDAIELAFNYYRHKKQRRVPNLEKLNWQMLHQELQLNIIIVSDQTERIQRVYLNKEYVHTIMVTTRSDLVVMLYNDKYHTHLPTKMFLNTVDYFQS